MGYRIVLVAMLMFYCNGCCGYGGAGCNDPLIGGICEGMVPLGLSTATVSFADDTGLHPSEYRNVSAWPAAHLIATKGDSVGGLILDARKVGAAQLSLAGAEGHERGLVFQYSISVVEALPEEFFDPSTCAIVPETVTGPD